MNGAQPSHIKFPCPLCAGPLEVPTESIGQFAPCPHCGQEIPLEKPVVLEAKASSMGKYFGARNRSAVKAGAQTLNAETQKLVNVGYLLAILFPVIGFFFGFFLLTKNLITQGITCMVLSLIFSALWWLVIVAVLF